MSIQLDFISSSCSSTKGITVCCIKACIWSLMCAECISIKEVLKRKFFWYSALVFIQAYPSWHLFFFVCLFLAQLWSLAAFMQNVCAVHAAVRFPHRHHGAGKLLMWHVTNLPMFGAFRNHLNFHVTRKTWRGKTDVQQTSPFAGRLQWLSAGLTSWRASCRWRCIPSRRRGSPWPRAPSGGCSQAGCPGCSRGPWRPCRPPARWRKPWGCPRTAAAASVKWRELISVFIGGRWEGAVFCLFLVI